MESYVVLQQKLDTHKRLYKEADASIKRMNGLETNARLVTANSERRKVSLEEDTKAKKRKSYDEQKISLNNKRIVATNHHNESAEEADTPSVKSSIVSSAPQPIKSKEDLIRLQNKGINVQRNKRIFGHLLGTLTQFKTDDKVRSSTTQAIHRKELEKKIEIQKIEDKKKFIEDKKRLEEEKLREQKNVEILEAKIQLAKAFEQWKSNQLQFKNFIRTKTKPYVFYLPKELNADTQRLLDETASLIDAQIAKRLKETEAELEILTKKSARLNNEHEVEMNKENNKKSDMESDSDSEMMDDEKNGINVRLEDEENEEAVEAADETNEVAGKTESPELTEDVSNEDLADDNM